MNRNRKWCPKRNISSECTTFICMDLVRTFTASQSMKQWNFEKFSRILRRNAILSKLFPQIYLFIRVLLLLKLFYTAQRSHIPSFRNNIAVEQQQTHKICWAQEKKNNPPASSLKLSIWCTRSRFKWNYKFCLHWRVERWWTKQWRLRLCSSTGLRT